MSRNTISDLYLANNISRGEPSSTPLNYMRSKAICKYLPVCPLSAPPCQRTLAAEKCITKVARRGGVKNPEPCTFDATRDTIVKKIQQVSHIRSHCLTSANRGRFQVMAEVQVISHFTGNEVITAREISLAMRCIDQKFFGVPCTESGILSTLRGMKLSNCA